MNIPDSDRPDRQTPARTLRKLAEQHVQNSHTDLTGMSPDEIQQLVHELQVHQVELELQAQELFDAQAELSRTRDRYTDLYEYAPVGYLTLDEQSVIREANRTAAQLLDTRQSVLTGRRLAELVTPAYLDPFWLCWREALETGTRTRCELPVTRPDGSLRDVQLDLLVHELDEAEDTGTGSADAGSTRTADSTAGNSPVREVRVTLSDITDRVQTEARLASSEHRYRRLTDAVIDYVFTVHVENGRTVKTVHGPNCQAITGYLPQELETNSLLWIAMVPEEDRPAVEQHIQQVLAGEEPEALEHRLRRKDGEQRWVLRVTSPQYDDQGRLIAYDGLLRDITRRRNAEEKLRAEESIRSSEASTRAILASLAAHIAVIDRTGRITAVNPAWEQFARENEGAPLRCNEGANYLQVCRDATGPDAAQAKHVAARLQALLDGRSDAFSLEYPCHSETEERWFFLQATSLQNEDIGAVISHTNITDRVKAEEHVRVSQERLKAILNTATDAIITIDQSGVVEDINPATERMFGYTAAELTGQKVNRLMPPPYCDEHDDYIARYLATGEARIIGIGREVTGRRKDGSTFPVDLAVSEVDHMKIFAGIIRDISSRKRLEREVLDIAAAEQQRIGQDLHDDLGQRLGGLGMIADALARTLSRHDPLPPEAGMARQIQEHLKDAVGLVRTLADGLVPVDVTSHNLADVLRTLAGRFHDPDGVQCFFECLDNVDIKDNFMATQLFRITQEAATNAVRHGSPRHIWITLEKTDSVGRLRIHDDGRGFEVPSGDLQGEGVGLRSMRYRASQIGGNLTVQSLPGEGTTVTCTVPLSRTR